MQVKTYEDVLNVVKELEIKSSRINRIIIGTKKELKELPSVLNADEKILYMAPGMWEKNNWLMVCTDKRVLFLDKGLVYRFNLKEIPVERINSVESKRSLFFGQLHLWSGSAKIIVTYCPKGDVQKFASAVNFAINQQKGNKQGQKDSYSKINQLKELQELLEAKVLTSSEFEIEKKRILKG